MRGSQAKDMRDLMDKVNRLDGWRVEFSSRTGWKVYPPQPHSPISVAHGPRNGYRARKNTIAKLRRAGAPI